jgi:hypothetical protein
MVLPAEIQLPLGARVANILIRSSGRDPAQECPVAMQARDDVRHFGVTRALDGVSLQVPPLPPLAVVTIMLGSLAFRRALTTERRRGAHGLS